MGTLEMEEPSCVTEPGARVNPSTLEVFLLENKARMWIVAGVYFRCLWSQLDLKAKAIF